MAMMSAMARDEMGANVREVMAAEGDCSAGQRSARHRRRLVRSLARRVLALAVHQLQEWEWEPGDSNKLSWTTRKIVQRGRRQGGTIGIERVLMTISDLQKTATMMI